VTGVQTCALPIYAGCVRDAHFMLQREVVQRMGARPGTPDYGRLSVMLQYRWNIDPLFDVPSSAFSPAPKVWSSVVRMNPHVGLGSERRGLGEALKGK